MNYALTLLGWNLCLSVPFALLAWCVCRIGPVQYRPALCHGIWLLVLLKLLTPPMIPVPIFPALTPLTEVPPSLASEWHQLQKPLQSKFYKPASTITPIDALASFLHDDTSHTDGETKNAGNAIREPSWRSVTIVFLATSAIVTLTIWFAAIRQFRRVRRLLHQEIKNSARVSSLLSELASRFQLKTKPKLCIVESAIAPMLWAEPGSPAVVLSRQMVDALNDNELRHVIAHELAHFSRKDHWTNLFEFLVTSLFWWHPVVWFARRELNLAAECCCDALVLKQLSESRKSYAQTLLTVVDFINSGSLLRPALAVTFGEKSALQRRIQMLANSNLRLSISCSGWWLLVMGALTLLLLPARAHEIKRSVATLALPAANSIVSDVGTDRVIDTISRLVAKRDAHTIRVQSLDDELVRQKLAGEFPPIERELEELVALEKQYRGQRPGIIAIVQLSFIASSYSGTNRPVHKALDIVLENLHKYGQMRDTAIAFERLWAHDGMKTLDALTHLIASDESLPFVRESARLCRARWQLEMVANRDMDASDLETLSDPTDIARKQDYLKKDCPSQEEAEQWKQQAFSELDELAVIATDHHAIVFKAVDPSGIVFTEDTERTKKSPTIAAVAKGLSFRANYLVAGSEAPKLEVELITGEKWALRNQNGKLVMVHFSFKGCGPCEQLYPVLRDIARNYPDKVSVLSIMADESIDITRDIVDSEKMNWNVAWDGAHGPIATHWGIRTFPSVILFGADNKLLFDIPGEFLSDVVNELLRQDAN